VSPSAHRRGHRRRQSVTPAHGPKQWTGSVWVPDIRFTSCDLRVFMDQPTEAISSHDPRRRRQDNWHAGLSGGACPKARCGRGRCNGRRTPPAPTAAAGIPRSASDPAPHGEPCPPTAPRRHPQRHAWTTTPVWVGPTAPDQVAMPSQQRGRLHQQPAPDRAGQQPRQPSQHRAVSPVQIGVGPPAGGAPQPRAATSAAPRCWSPSAVPAAPAIARAGRRSDRAVEVPSIDHRR
jgi:hypothetical protein